jgi:hypothetical protein
MLYNLSDVVVKNILAIVNNAVIKGAEAVAVIEITAALSAPVVDSGVADGKTPKPIKPEGK